MVKSKVREGNFGGEAYEWKIESERDQWELLEEIADMLDKNYRVESVECSGDMWPDFSGDEYTSCESVADMKKKMDRIRETADSVSFTVICGDGEDDWFRVGVYMHHKNGIVVCSGADDFPEENKKLDKLIKEAFDK